MISARIFIVDAEGNETEVHRDLAKEAAEFQAELDALAARVAADPGLPMRAILAGQSVIVPPGGDGFREVALPDTGIPWFGSKAAKSSP